MKLLPVGYDDNGRLITNPPEFYLKEKLGLYYQQGDEYTAHYGFYHRERFHADDRHDAVVLKERFIDMMRNHPQVGDRFVEIGEIDAGKLHHFHNYSIDFLYAVVGEPPAPAENRNWRWNLMHFRYA